MAQGSRLPRLYELEGIYLHLSRFYSYFTDVINRVRSRFAGSSLERLFPYLAILVANYAVYLKTLTFGYTSLDDFLLVSFKASFFSDPASLIDAFRQTVFNVPGDQYYRPLLTLSFIADHFLGNHSPFMYHLSNIVYHVAASGLLYALLRETGSRRRVSLALVLLFTVHPVLMQAVAWIPGRNDSLMGIAVFSSFICYARYMKSGSYRCLAFSGLFFFLGLFIKENVLPAAALFSLYHYLYRKEGGSLRAILTPWGMWIPLIAAWFIIRSLVIIELEQLTWFALMKNLIVTVIPGLLQYIGKIFFPYNLSVMPYLNDISVVPGIAAVCLLIAAIALSRPKRWNVILFGLAWFVFFTAPVMVHNQPELYEHRVYVSMAGIIIIFSELSKSLSPLAGASLRRGIWAAFFLIFSVSSFLQCNSFQSPLMFSLNASLTSPSSAKAHSLLSESCMRLGHVAAAKKAAFRALEIDPRNSSANRILGNILLFYENDKPGARYRYLVACAGNPGSDAARALLANYYYCVERYPEAKQNMLIAMRINGKNPMYPVFVYDMVDLIRKSRDLPPAPRPKAGVLAASKQ